MSSPQWHSHQWLGRGGRRTARSWRGGVLACLGVPGWGIREFGRHMGKALSVRVRP